MRLSPLAFERGSAALAKGAVGAAAAAQKSDSRLCEWFFRPAPNSAILKCSFARWACAVKFGMANMHDNSAEWSEALAASASPKELGLEPHSCHFGKPSAWKRFA